MHRDTLPHEPGRAMPPRPAARRGERESPGEAPAVLVTGATGYVGSRLVPRLAAAGCRVRALSRQPARLRGRVPAGVEVVAGDLLDPAGLDAAFAGAEVVYDLVHSMGSAGDFREKDRRAARALADAAARAGARRIVYLGALGSAADLSAHLASRQEVGRILRASPVPTLELQASIILGAGSLSFEMISALVERLPVMVMPRWVSQRAQPIAIDDVLAYLEAALELPLETSWVVQLGGPDRVSYRDLMREYARQRGLRRLMLPVPVLTPRLSSLWLALVTPLYARVGRELIEGLRNETLVESDEARRLFPGIRPRPVTRALAEALAERSPRATIQPVS